jgi:hypothetical protein
MPKDFAIWVVRRGKTDQEQQGRQVPVAFGERPETCPVRASAAWLEAAGIIEGPLFRAVDRHGNVSSEPLDPGSIARILKKAARRSGMDPAEAAKIAGHSLRSGTATAAAIAGASEREIAALTGHRSQEVRRYIRVPTSSARALPGVWDCDRTGQRGPIWGPGSIGYRAPDPALYFTARGRKSGCFGERRDSSRCVPTRSIASGGHIKQAGVCPSIYRYALSHQPGLSPYPKTPPCPVFRMRLGVKPREQSPIVPKCYMAPMLTAWPINRASKNKRTFHEPDNSIL